MTAIGKPKLNHYSSLSTYPSPGHMGSCLSREAQTLFFPLWEYQGIPKPAKKCNLSSISGVCPGVLSQKSMPETPQQKEVWEELLPKPFQLALNTGGQRLSSDLLLCMRAPHTIPIPASSPRTSSLNHTVTNKVKNQHWLGSLSTSNVEWTRPLFLNWIIFYWLACHSNLLISILFWCSSLVLHFQHPQSLMVIWISWYIFNVKTYNEIRQQSQYVHSEMTLGSQITAMAWFILFCWIWQRM